MLIEYLEKIKLFTLNKQEKKAFIYILSLSLFSLYSLLQANSLYLDDYWRLVDGNQGWNFNARPLATQITLLLQLGRPFTDISPLTQIFSIAIYSLGIIYLGRLFQIKNLVLFILTGVITIINPYNLSIYTYVLDCLTMTLGIFSAILSLYFASIAIENTKKVTPPFIFGYCFSVLFLIISLCFYQTCISIYFIGFMFLLLTRLSQTKNYQKSIINLLLFGSILIFSIILYIPLKNQYQMDEYTLRHSQLPNFNNLANTIFNNITKSWQKIQFHLGNSLIIVLIISLISLVFIAILVNIFLTKNGTKKGIRINLINTILSLCYYSLIITSFIFPSYILANAPFHPRIFMGFTVVTGFSCFFLIDSLSRFKYKIIDYIFIFYFSLIFLSFTNLSLTYGNVLHQQNLYEERMGTLIINDLEIASNKYSISLNQPKVTFINSEKVNSLRRNILNVKALEKYPILDSLAYPYFSGDNFGITKLQTFGLNIKPQLNQEFFSQSQGYYIPSHKPIINRQLYNIYLEKDDTFIVFFKE